VLQGCYIKQSRLIHSDNLNDYNFGYKILMLNFDLLKFFDTMIERQVFKINKNLKIDVKKPFMC